jgi:hypothetical protein
MKIDVLLYSQFVYLRYIIDVVFWWEKIVWEKHSRNIQVATTVM